MYLYVYIHTYIYIYVFVDTYVFIHIYTHIHSKTYWYIYIYIYVANRYKHTHTQFDLPIFFHISQRLGSNPILLRGSCSLPPHDLSSTANIPKWSVFTSENNFWCLEIWTLFWMSIWKLYTCLPQIILFFFFFCFVFSIDLFVWSLQRRAYLDFKTILDVTQNK